MKGEGGAEIFLTGIWDPYSSILLQNFRNNISVYMKR